MILLAAPFKIVSCVVMLVLICHSRLATATRPGLSTSQDPGTRDASSSPDPSRQQVRPRPSQRHLQIQCHNGPPPDPRHCNRDITQRLLQSLIEGAPDGSAQDSNRIRASSSDGDAGANTTSPHLAAWLDTLPDPNQPNAQTPTPSQKPRPPRSAIAAILAEPDLFSPRPITEHFYAVSRGNYIYPHRWCYQTCCVSVEISRPYSYIHNNDAPVVGGEYNTGSGGFWEYTGDATDVTTYANMVEAAALVVKECQIQNKSPVGMARIGRDGRVTVKIGTPPTSARARHW